jgi:GNAT superfamily N-acetyltransferase
LLAISTGPLMLTIRSVEPQDVSAVYTLIRDLARYEKLLDAVESSETQLHDALFCERPRVFCDVAQWREAGHVETVGMALWFYNYSTFRGRHGIYLEDLFVRPEMRGRGIGKALLLGLADRCAREDLARLEWSVLDWNEPAIRFYKSLGAAPLDEWTVFRLTGDALVRRA